MALVTLRGYARSRKARGLPGGSPAAVKKAIDTHRIPRLSDGRIDEATADDAWRRNTMERCPSESSYPARSPVAPVATKERPRTRAEQEAEFHQGATWMAVQVCRSARRVWPAFVLEHWPEMSRPEQVRLIVVLCARLEAWTAAERTAAALPEFDWRGLFGADAALAASEYEQLGREWPAAGAIVLGCAPDNTPGAAFMQGARACARAICVTARRLLPSLIDGGVFEPSVGEDQSCTVHLVAVILALLEGWVCDYTATAWLPPIDWDSVFPGGAADAAERYRVLRQEWAG